MKGGIMRKINLLLVTVVFLFFGCSTIEVCRDFNPGIVKDFKEGVTTKREVLTKLGKPFSQSLDQNGNEVWFYMYTNSKAKVAPISLIIPGYVKMGSDVESKNLTLTFKNGTIGKIN